MTKTKLWELADEISQLENELTDISEDETLNDEQRETKLQETFDRWLDTEESFKVKAEQVAAYISHQEALADARKIESIRIRNLATQAQNQANRMREYLTNQMILSGIDTIEGLSVNISLRKKSPKVVLNIPVEELPEEFMNIQCTPRIADIKKMLKLDKDNVINWAKLSENHEYSLVIR